MTPPIRCPRVPLGARRRPPLSGDVRCHCFIDVREASGGRGFRRSGPRARGRSPAVNGRPRVVLGHDRRPCGSRSHRSRPRGSTRAIGPAARHNLRCVGGEWTARGGRQGSDARVGRARRSRTTARDGRRIHADTAPARRPSRARRRRPARAARRHAQPRSETIAPSHPRSTEDTQLPNLPAHKTRSADHSRRHRSREDRSRGRPPDGLRRTRAAGATR